MHELSPCSVLANGGGLDVLEGVIDSSYRDEIKVILINFGTETITVNSGDRIGTINL